MCVCVCLQLGLSVEGLGIWRYRCVAAVLGCANVLAQAEWIKCEVAGMLVCRVSVWSGGVWESVFCYRLYPSVVCAGVWLNG